jgi:subtilisin family serine protease
MAALAAAALAVVVPLPATATDEPIPARDGTAAVAPGMEIAAVIELRPGPAPVVRAADDVGVTVLAADASQLTVTGSVSDIERLATSDHVTAWTTVRRPYEASLSEGVPIIGTEVWTGSGYTGSGTTVAVVDSGFSGYAQRLGTDLPAAVTTRSFRLDGLTSAGSGHGTAVAEIVHDVAPGADLILVSIDNDLMFPSLVDFLISSGVDVVTMSIGWTNGPYDGSADITTEVERATAAGILWVNAAGNEAETHWAGSAIDADNDDSYEFPDGSEINGFTVPPGGRFSVDLAWTNRNADLDLCLMEYTGADANVARCAQTTQEPGNVPVEAILWQNPTGSTKRYGYTIRHWSGSPGRIDVFVGGQAAGLDHVDPSSSLVVPAESPHVLAVGAVHHQDPAVVATYSSRGPSVAGYVKPDLVAPSHVTTASVGTFSGSSAAAPHVAGMAALLLSTDGMSPGLARTELERSAVPLGPGDKTNTWGWGRAHVGPLPGIRLEVAGARLQRDSVGAVDTSQGRWHLSGVDGSTTSFYFGEPGDIPFTGDWDCNGSETPGMYRPADGFAYLRNSATQGTADTAFWVGNPGDVPLAGDFNGDGCDTLSVFRPSTATMYVANRLGTHGSSLGVADASYAFGNPNDIPFAADFDGNGRDDIGLHRPDVGTVYYRTSHTAGPANGSFVFGNPGDHIIAADWVGTGDSVAVYRPAEARFYFRTDNGSGPASGEVRFGAPDWTPVAGYWNW